jgi:tRNA pseudouridine55 synthase
MNRKTDAPRRFHRDIDGILLLDKACGVSSNAALQQVRILYGATKAGHAGSLDPLAEGMLPVCFGQATKVCGRLLGSGKAYRVKLRLGARTESGDLETEVVERAPIPTLSDEEVDATLARFLGTQQQVPPMHSALKFEGKRLYEYARRGESVERTPRQIHIDRLQRVGRGAEHLEFDVDCSKGTYIRTLAADIAVALGTLGYVETLRRLHVQPFEGERMYTLDELSALSASERDRLLLPTDSALRNLPSVAVDQAGEEGLLLGRTVEASGIPAGQSRAYGPDGRFLGLVERTPDGRIKPARLFVTVPERPASRPSAPS